MLLGLARPTATNRERIAILRLQSSQPAPRNPERHQSPPAAAASTPRAPASSGSWPGCRPPYFHNRLQIQDEVNVLGRQQQTQLDLAGGSAPINWSGLPATDRLPYHAATDGSSAPAPQIRVWVRPPRTFRPTSCCMRAATWISCQNFGTCSNQQDLLNLISEERKLARREVWRG